MATRAPDAAEARAQGRRTTAAAPARPAIENVRPAVQCGRYPIKRTLGESVTVTADAHADGHDALRVVLLWRREGEDGWHEEPMDALGNDAWRGAFPIRALEPHLYAVEAWPDRFASWRRDLARKARAGVHADVDLQAGAALVEEAARRSRGADARLLRASAAALRGEGSDGLAERVACALEKGLAALMERHPDRRGAARSRPELRVSVDRERARLGAWYEMFPRSCSPAPGRHGTFADCEARLGYVAAMGFDVVYLPPIHPIGRSHRKGRNNGLRAEPGDPGSPWAIGAREGGHTAIHPELGGLDDFRRLLARARELGMEVALDLAFQCAPDHPWVEQHPEWFIRRPDGSVQHAENPPKKYEDIYPLHFDGPDWRGLWDALLEVVLFWVAQGVRAFRVDNPHTKPYAFWEWLIAEVRRRHPEVFFLSEAFTRPKVLYHLARIGFSQSYTYFAWRNTKRELTEFMGELAGGELAEFFRPNLWPNTPDILPEPLQYGGRPAFAVRLLLAATLGASYGIYGPAFELAVGRGLRPGGEEYLDSEKYALRHWELDDPASLRELIARVNRIRRDHPALHSDRRLRFHHVDNDQLIAYSKTSEALDDVVVTVANLDPHHPQSGWLELPAAELGLPEHGGFQVHDLISDARYFWSGPRNYVRLDPACQPGHVFHVRRRVRSEHDFDYYL